jgi:hypothetical protein
LMPQGVGIGSGQLGRTPPANLGLQDFQSVAVFRGYQLLLMSRVTRLAAPLPLPAFFLFPRWLRVRVLTTGRQRGVR